MEYLFDKAIYKLRKARHAAAADKILDLKKKSGSNPWPVIEEIIKVWIAEHPRKWDATLIELDNLRETRKDPKYASTKDKVTGGYLRYILDLPISIHSMIRSVYNVEELPMNKEFFHEFAIRFPRFKVAEKI